MRYVAGFLFDAAGERVALIHKEHGPSAVVGHWNAIGGKQEFKDLEDSRGSYWEPANNAMQREFEEETGVLCVHWTHFLTLRGNGWEVNFFEAYSDELIEKVRTTTDEEVRWFWMDDLPDLVPNVTWILPMARGHNDEHVHVYEVIERVAFA